MASGGAQLGRNIAGKILVAAVYAVTILLAIYVTRIYLDYPQTDDAYDGIRDLVQVLNIDLSKLGT